jgi:hypothetical protein
MNSHIVNGTLFYLLLTAQVFAIPAPEFATTDVEGTVDSVVWQAERQVKGLPGLSGSAGMDRTIPAKYQIRLTDTKVTSDGQGLDPFATGDPITIELEHPKDDGKIKKGMVIKVHGYKMKGDEGGFHTTFEKLEVIDDKNLENAESE